MNRIRKSNFSKEEEQCLMHLVAEHVGILEDPSAGTDKWKKKSEIWAIIADTFNSLCNNCHRAVPELQAKYKQIKGRIKREKAQLTPVTQPICQDITDYIFIKTEIEEEEPIIVKKQMDTPTKETRGERQMLTPAKEKGEISFTAEQMDLDIPIRNTVNTINARAQTSSLTKLTDKETIDLQIGKKEVEKSNGKEKLLEVQLKLAEQVLEKNAIRISLMKEKLQHARLQNRLLELEIQKKEFS